jgi:hypothetical protein
MAALEALSDFTNEPPLVPSDHCATVARYRFEALSVWPTSVVNAPVVNPDRPCDPDEDVRALAEFWTLKASGRAGNRQPAK